METAIGLDALTVFAKKLHLRPPTGFQMRIRIGDVNFACEWTAGAWN